MKKILLSLGMVVSIGAPIVGVVSCSEEIEKEHTNSILKEVRAHIDAGWKIKHFDFNDIRYSHVEKSTSDSVTFILGFGLTEKSHESGETLRPTLHILLQKGNQAKSIDIPLETYDKENIFKVRADVTEELNHLVIYGNTKQWVKDNNK